MSITGTLYAPDHQIYRPCDPPVSNFGVLALVEIGQEVGYRRGFKDGVASVPVVLPCSDKAAILKRLRQLSAAVNRERAGKAAVLVDFDRTQRIFYETVLACVEAL